MSTLSLSSFLPALLGGVLIGFASWLVLASLGRVAGISGIASAAFFAPKNSSQQENSQDGTWRLMFLVGLVVGGTLFAALLATPAALPKNSLLLAAAGLLVGFGTVTGSGCTSGHGVCGLGRRSIRSLVATCTFMATGFATVFVAAKLGYPLI